MAVRAWLAGVAAIAVLVAAASAWPRGEPARAPSAACTTKRLPPAASTGEVVLWGHARSLARAGSRYRLRFDPALWLSGETANRAAIEDKAIPAGDTVPNDYYVRDETHGLLTFRVPVSARATVITFAGGTAGFCATRVPVSELAAIVAGRNPRGRRLYVRGNRLGFWIRYRLDSIRSLDQQYQP